MDKWTWQEFVNELHALAYERAKENVLDKLRISFTHIDLFSSNVPLALNNPEIDLKDVKGNFVMYMGASLRGHKFIPAQEVIDEFFEKYPDAIIEDQTNG